MCNLVIIMATFNGAQYIEEQIESIMSNDNKDFVLHVCDDGSSDNIFRILKKLKEKYKDRIILHKNEKNLGVIQNFLYWIKRVEADYYMLADQDDIWYENKISKSLEYIKSIEEKNPGLPVAIYANATIVDRNHRVLSDSFFEKEGINPYKNSFYDLLMENKLLGCTVMFNKETKRFIKMVDNIPDEVRMHDWWIGLVASAFGIVQYLDEPLLMYRQHGENQVGATGVITYLWKNKFKFIEQREKLIAIFKQGEAFLDCYKSELKPEQIDYLERFSSIYRDGLLQRKYNFIKRGYRKTGVVRNLGMFLLI